MADHPRIPAAVAAVNATDPSQLCRERAARIDAAVSLSATDRAPLVYTSGFWSAHPAGVSFQEAMYGTGKHLAATRHAVELLLADALCAISFPLGVALEGIDYRPMKWPRHAADPNVTFQYLDQGMMSAAEYDAYLATTRRSGCRYLFMPARSKYTA